MRYIIKCAEHLYEIGKNSQLVKNCWARLLVFSAMNESANNNNILATILSIQKPLKLMLYTNTHLTQDYQQQRNQTQNTRTHTHTQIHSQQIHTHTYTQGYCQKGQNTHLSDVSSIFIGLSQTRGRVVTGMKLSSSPL